MTHYANYMTTHAAHIAASNLNTPRVKPVRDDNGTTYTARPRRKYVTGPAFQFPTMTAHQQMTWAGVYAQ